MCTLPINTAAIHFIQLRMFLAHPQNEALFPDKFTGLSQTLKNGFSVSVNICLKVAPISPTPDVCLKEQVHTAAFPIGSILVYTITTEILVTREPLYKTRVYYAVQK